MPRRRFRSTLRASAIALAVACAAAWLVGRALTDRFAWSQPVSWVPTPLLVAPVWLGALVAWRSRRPPGRPSGRPRARRAAGALTLAALVMTLHLAAVEMRLARRPLASPGPLRIVFWNQAGHDLGDLSAPLLGLSPDILVLANRHSDTGTRDIAQAFIDTGEAHAAVGWPFDLFTRVPIIRWADTPLGLEGRSRRGDGSLRDDPGWAAWYELDVGGRPLIVWALDLPSDIGAARLPIARRAGEALGAWRGQVRVVEPGGGWHSEPWGPVGFPAPDVVVGDFNIPRGSASLGVLFESAGVGPMANAFDEAGRGWQRTWPRRWPAWAIDQCFVGAGAPAVSHEVRDLGVGGHRAVVVGIQRD